MNHASTTSRLTYRGLRSPWVSSVIQELICISPASQTNSRGRRWWLTDSCPPKRNGTESGEDGTLGVAMKLSTSEKAQLWPALRLKTQSHLHCSLVTSELGLQQMKLRGGVNPASVLGGQCSFQGLLRGFILSYPYVLITSPDVSDIYVSKVRPSLELELWSPGLFRSYCVLATILFKPIELVLALFSLNAKLLTFNPKAGASESKFLPKLLADTAHQWYCSFLLSLDVVQTPSQRDQLDLLQTPNHPPPLLPQAREADQEVRGESWRPNVTPTPVVPRLHTLTLFNFLKIFYI